ncbi:MAG: hypothetical protein LBI38_04825 [Oscillospiraceae bacterium]|jgi:hypothetical protein|nr:hypothetical protein [Oscillospiraceae bacterium]
MNKGLGILFVGILALIGGAVFAAMFIKKKLTGNEIDFDDFDTAVDDEEFENFFGEGEEGREGAKSGESEEGEPEEKK